MDWKNLHGYIEVSPFMLFESAGDSEEGSDLNSCSVVDDNVDVTCDGDVDDAQSCCSNPSEICSGFDKDQLREYSYSNKVDRKRMHDEDEDDDDGSVNQECSIRNEGFVLLRTHKKCKVYVDSNIESLMKEEKDKLFWDTCLAS